VLVYSTCTISATENESLIAAFLDSHADFSLDDLATQMPAYARGRVPAATLGARAAEVAARCLLTLPDRDGTAGFFIARLRRS
jgi:16S rRNA C967 or C1407 C5-methylase (RsmB/RsmF family)